jgi:hypothetical protein
MFAKKFCLIIFGISEVLFTAPLKSVYEYAIHIFIVYIFAPGTASRFLRHYKLEILPILHSYLFIYCSKHLELEVN